MVVPPGIGLGVAFRVLARAAPGRNMEAPRTVPAAVAAPPINRRRETIARCACRSPDNGEEIVFVFCDPASTKENRLSEFIGKHLLATTGRRQALNSKGSLL